MKRWANRFESAVESTESAAEFSKTAADFSDSAAEFSETPADCLGECRRLPKMHHGNTGGRPQAALKAPWDFAENAAGFAPAAASPTLYKAIVGAKERIFLYTHNPYF